MVLRCYALTLLVVLVTAAAADQSATEASALTTATTTSSTPPSKLTVVTPVPSASPGTTPVTLYPRDTPVYAPEPRFPWMELIVECFAQLSLPCAQRKMVVYLDRLNRARRVSIFGELLELIKTRADTAPPLTEEVLTARQIQDQDSLSRLLEMMTERFMDSHVLRLNLPLLEDGKLITSPVDINFVDAAPENAREGRGHGGGGGKKKQKKKKKAQKKMKKKGKNMMKMMMVVGKKMVQMTGKMIMYKMMMMFPIVIGKSMFGGMAGMMSMGIMKLMMLKAVFQKIKNFLSKCKGGGGGLGGDFLGGGDSCGGGGYDRWDSDDYTNTYYSTKSNSNQNAYPYSYYVLTKNQWLK